MAERDDFQVQRGRDRTRNRTEWSIETTTDVTKRGYRRTFVTSIEATRTVFSIATAAAKPDLEQALAYLDRQQREQRSELLLELTAASFWLLDLPSVERLASEALDLAEQVHRSDLAANAMGWLAHARSGHGDLVGAIEMNSAAIVRAGGARTVTYCDAPAESLPRRACD